MFIRLPSPFVRNNGSALTPHNILRAWPRILTLGIFCYWLAQTPGFSSEPLPLFILVGQSNMTGADSDTDASTPGQVGGDANVLFWNRSAYQGIQWENDDQFRPLRIQNSAPYGGLIIGPEFGFVRQMQASGKMARLAIVKVSFPSTSMAAEWQIGGFAYKALREEMEQALTALKQAGEQPVVCGFLVHQGISDALHGGAMAMNYRERLSDFIARIRSDFATPTTPVVLARENLSPIAKPVLMEIVRASIVAVAEATPATAISAPRDDTARASCGNGVKANSYQTCSPAAAPRSRRRGSTWASYWSPRTT
jgi:hypothetical protein